MKILQVILIFICFSFVTVVSVTRPVTNIGFDLVIKELIESIPADNLELTRVVDKIIVAVNKLPDKVTFLKELQDISNEMEVPIHELLAKFYLESSIDPKRVNKKSKAAGIFQLMQFNMKDGMTSEKFSKLSATQQLKYYREYIRPYKKYLKGQGVVALYLANICPNALEKGYFVVYRSPSKEYTQNDVLDVYDQKHKRLGKDGVIDRYDIKLVMNRYLISKD